MASSPNTSWQIDGETMETVTDFIFWGSKSTADGDCSHEIKRHLLFGRKAMTNLDNILKSRYITLLTKVRLVKAMVLPVILWNVKTLTPEGLTLYLEWAPFLFIYTPVLLYWRRQWYPTPVLLPGKSHGWRSLEGCSPWGRWGLDTTEWLHFHFSLSSIGEGNGNPLQHSCLENPRDREAWWAAVFGVSQSQTRLKWLSSSSSSSRMDYLNKD